jgi:hypothetical protein
MVKLKITLNGLIEGLESYRDLSLEDESASMNSVLCAIEGAQAAITEVQKRGYLWKYLYGSSDKAKVKGAVDLLTNAQEAIMTKIMLANAGALRGQFIT